MIPSWADRKYYLDGTSRTRNGRERDGQRQKLYDAEQAGIPEGQELPTVPDMQSYVNNMLNSKWWQNRFILERILVKDGRGRRSAVGYITWRGGTVKMPRWARRELWLLHEIAHVLVAKPHAAHGRLFACIYLELVRWQMGEKAYESLQDAYRQHSVKWHPHRKEQFRKE